MLDIKFIRDNVDLVQRSANDKGYKVDIATLLQLDDERRDLQKQVEARIIWTMPLAVAGWTLSAARK